MVLEAEKLVLLSFRANSRIRYNAGYERLQICLRTLLIGVAIAAMLTAWVLYQLDWIKQRHEFLQTEPRGFYALSGWPQRRTAAPWSIRVFGEKSLESTIIVEHEQLKRGQSLFPESDFHVQNEKDFSVLP